MQIDFRFAFEIFSMRERGRWPFVIEDFVIRRQVERNFRSTSLSIALLARYSRTFWFLPAELSMPSENWDTTSCVHPLHYLPSERRVAPCPPKARCADIYIYISLSLLYMHSLTDRIMGYNRHATSRSVSSSWISTHLNVQHCIVSAKRATWCLPLSIELDILPRYTICFITSREISKLILIRQKEWENAPVTWIKRRTLLIFPRSYE